MSNEVWINGRRLAADAPPYVVAEVSANHNGSLERAKAIISAAGQAGVDAVKLQTYRPDTITLPADSADFRIEGGLWHGRTLYDLYEEAHLPWDWHAPLFEHARKLGLTIFSSPFDNTAVDLLEDLGAPAYKIASFEAVDLPLIRYVASTGKPMVISTGMANQDEIAEAVATARDNGCSQLIVLHCVSGYPAPAGDYNLRTLVDMAQRYPALVGLSDHTLDNATAVAATALGACFIEKHFTLDRSGGGPDDSFSLEPDDLARLCRDVKTAWESLGQVHYERSESERGNAQFRRSLYFVKDLQAGDVIDADSIRSVRPGYGLAPRYFDELLGKTLTRSVQRYQPVRWDYFD
ncbi:pseudaminic acid synthase [Saccharospirillum sp. HFRX-1]|uniref:pseudaminic acid synthase n=1 Tax=unclassified Saccharospirillum TaxID=2633430 RepID=UPI00371B8D5E